LDDEQGKPCSVPEGNASTEAVEVTQNLQELVKRILDLLTNMSIVASLIVTLLFPLTLTPIEISDSSRQLFGMLLSI
jgi:hypothetical protein